MHIKKIFKNSKGDTIVEVLLSIAVLSLVLTVSYALSNRDTQYVQQSQERGEAQKISEQQLELLRNYLTPDTPWGASDICIDEATQAPTPDASKCNKGTQDNGVGRYRVQIIPDSATNTYTIHTTWDSLTSNPVQTLDISYKLPNTQLVLTQFHAACSDSIDNDGDSKIDLADPGCSGVNDNDETDNPACNDGIDNDSDGLVDYPADPGCANALDIDEYNPPPIKLTVTKSPNAGGTVTGSGINCGSTCVVNNITANTNISLTATPAADYVFSSWNPSNCNSFTINTSTTCEANFTYVPRVPLYRCYNTSATDHYYTVYSWLCYNGITSTYPWILYEGVTGYVPTGGPYPSLYVYGGYNASIGDSFYTTSYDEYVGAHYGGWWDNSGYQGWSLYPGDCSVPGTVPLYRRWHGGIGDHFYTTNPAEALWYTYEGVQGCLFANP